MSEFTLQFPKQISKEIGLHSNEINAFKARGCRFYGTKTCVAWVREYLQKITATESLTAPAGHQQRSTSSISDGQGRKSG